MTSTDYFSSLTHLGFFGISAQANLSNVGKGSRLGKDKDITRSIFDNTKHSDTSFMLFIKGNCLNILPNLVGIFDWFDYALDSLKLNRGVLENGVEIHQLYYGNLLI